MNGKNKLQITCLDNDCVTLYKKFWGEHGLSFLVEWDDRAILLDTGTSSEIMAHNLELLGKDLSKVTHLVLSHGHYDHTGALDWVLSQTRHPVVVADPSVFAPKYDKREEEKKYIGIPLTEEQVRQRADLHLTADVYRIAEGITVSGRVPRVTSYETSPDTMLVELEPGSFTVDTFIDDLSLFLETENGLVLLCGCCHAGLINTLAHARKTIPMPVYAILGGVHLNEASQERIDKTIEALRDEYKPEFIYLNHCSGDDAIVAMKNAFGKKVQACPAGFSKAF